jgi:uncharacterized protein YdaU (DUF1376 family)
VNYYTRHIGDYLKDTAHLTLLEHGVYARLLDVYYTRETPFAPGEATRLVGARTKEEKAAVDAVLAEFFVEGRQSRCDREIERYQTKAEHNRTVGKKGGRPPKTDTQTEPKNNPAGFCEEPKPNPPNSQQPIANSQRERDTRATRLPPAALLPDEWREWAQTERPDLDPTRVFSKFRDYWHGKAGKDGRKLDWLATWRNWVRDEKGQAANGQPFETNHQRLVRERIEKVAPDLAEKRPGPPHSSQLLEIFDVAPKRLG